MKEHENGQWKFSARPGGWLIAESTDGRRLRLMLMERHSKVSVSVNGLLWHGEIKQSGHGVSASAGGGDTDLVAQFPGKVRKILVTEGRRVEEGQALALIEAMKMEFSIKAPFGGILTRILVKEGQQLSPGERLFDLTSDLMGEAVGK